MIIPSAIYFISPAVAGLGRPSNGVNTAPILPSFSPLGGDSEGLSRPANPDVRTVVLPIIGNYGFNWSLVIGGVLGLFLAVLLFGRSVFKFADNLFSLDAISGEYARVNTEARRT